jgi:hypothetical protein
MACFHPPHGHRARSASHGLLDHLVHTAEQRQQEHEGEGTRETMDLGNTDESAAQECAI